MKGDDKSDIIEFLHFVNDSVIFVYNSKFDENFIRKEIEHWGIKNDIEIQFTCLMAIAKKMIKKFFPLYNKRDISLKNVCQLFGVPLINNFNYSCLNYDLEKKIKYLEIINKRKKLHNALGDSYFAAELIIKFYERINKKSNIHKNLYSLNKRIIKKDYEIKGDKIDDKKDKIKSEISVVDKIFKEYENINK